MNAHDPLVTVLIRPFDEPRVCAAIRAALGVGSRVEFVDSRDDPTLTEQWSIEHPHESLGDRRCRGIVVSDNDADDQRTAETIIDIISPHARAEDAAVSAGRAATATADEFPWSARAALWE